MSLISLLFHDVYVGAPHESGFVSPGADRYKLPAAAFEMQLDGIAESGLPVFTQDGTTGDEPSDAVAITVDDGGESYHRIVADRLEARGWRGHCFVTTDFIGHSRFLTAAQIRELDGRGHVIGSHSASHPARFSACRADEMRNEWQSSRQALEDILGHAVQVASLPGGYFSRTCARTASAAGLRWLFTSEPTTTLDQEQQCVLAGRFAIRHGSRPDYSRRLVEQPMWTRVNAWANWHAKGLIKPLLGSSYPRIADWLVPRRAIR